MMKKSNYDIQADISKHIFLKYDQTLFIQKYCLCSDEAWIYLEYMGVPCRINRKDGHIEESINDVWRECRSYNTVMTIYDLLCYHKGKTAPALFHRWCTLGSFVVTGVQETSAFTKRYAALFQYKVDALKAACTSIGGVLQTPIAGADITCRISVTPYFPVLFQFWDADEEFPPKVLLLWDQNADSFLHFETMFYLQGDLLERLKRQMIGS